MKNLCIILVLGASSLTLYGMSNVNQNDSLTIVGQATTETQQEIQQLKNDINNLQTRIAQEKARLNSLSGTQRILQAGPINANIAALNTQLSVKQTAYNTAQAGLAAAS